MKTTIRRTPPQKPQGRKFYHKPTIEIPGLILRIKEGGYFEIEHMGVKLKCTIVKGGRTTAIVFEGPREMLIHREKK
jgi:hypothetical protein